jgi:hypothetical protein
VKKVDDGTIDSEKAQARLRSSACRDASIFLETLSTAPVLQMPDGTFASGL